MNGDRFDLIYYDPHYHREYHEIMGAQGQRYIKIQLAYAAGPVISAQFLSPAQFMSEMHELGITSPRQGGNDSD